MNGSVYGNLAYRMAVDEALANKHRAEGFRAAMEHEAQADTDRQALDAASDSNKSRPSRMTKHYRDMRKEEQAMALKMAGPSAKQSTFTREDYREVQKEEATMSHTRTVRLNAMLSGFKRVRIQFDGSPKKYDYRAPREMGVKAGDTVVVDSPYTGLTLATVFAVDNTLHPDRPYQYKQIVSRVDYDGYAKRLEAEQALADKLDELEAKEAVNDVLAEMADIMKPESYDAFVKLVEAAKGRV